MDFIIDNHLQGLVIGICTFLIIGMFHPIVVKAEYYWSTRCWWLFLFLGIIVVVRIIPSFSQAASVLFQQSSQGMHL